MLLKAKVKNKRIIRFRMFFGVENQDKFLNRMGGKIYYLARPILHIHFKPTDTVWSQRGMA